MKRWRWLRNEPWGRRFRAAIFAVALVLLLFAILGGDPLGRGATVSSSGHSSKTPAKGFLGANGTLVSVPGQADALSPSALAEKAPPLQDPGELTGGAATGVWPDAPGLTAFATPPGFSSPYFSDLPKSGGMFDNHGLTNDGGGSPGGFGVAFNGFGFAGGPSGGGTGPKNKGGNQGDGSGNGNNQGGNGNGNEGGNGNQGGSGNGGGNGNGGGGNGPAGSEECQMVGQDCAWAEWKDTSDFTPPPPGGDDGRTWPEGSDGGSGGPGLINPTGETQGTAVSEPASLLTLGTGLIAMIGFARTKIRRG